MLLIGAHLHLTEHAHVVGLLAHLLAHWLTHLHHPRLLLLSHVHIHSHLLWLAKIHVHGLLLHLWLEGVHLGLETASGRWHSTHGSEAASTLTLALSLHVSAHACS